MKKKLPSLEACASYLLSLAFLLAIGSYCWLARPYPDTVLAKEISLRALTLPQRLNIQQAAARLNGAIILPGQQFSFNKNVGPRTEGRGFLPAPSYVGRDTSPTTGGGICLLSSTLYQMALECGLRIDARTPHLRTVSSAAPGLDATVWYGRADLIFTNSSNSPLEIVTESEGTFVRIKFIGERSKVAMARIHRSEQRLNPATICVEVTRLLNGKEEVVSRDLYPLSDCKARRSG